MQQAEKMTILPVFGDNYIYLAEYLPGQCFAVDPGDAAPVLNELRRKHIHLTHILMTHHHTDHIGGVETLRRETGSAVVGPEDRRMGRLNTVMGDGDILHLDDAAVRCISTPGHTSSSVCYFVTGSAFSVPVLFSGDTLFVCGCGRMFECDGQTMYLSLQKLTTLPDETWIYPGHDYTEENLQFALTLKPGDAALQEKLAQVRTCSASGQPTVPSTLAEEKKLNPFLAAGDWETFASLRRKKDVF